uniref:Uncharacterized protein n=1 Tax=Rhizophora mucronata TaxID=61149 RepID=A0A2P2KM21_RHIMU
MTDGYWNRQRPSMLPSGGMLKRPRSDYDLPHSGLPSSQEVHSYYPRDDDRSRYQAVKDTKTIGSAYDLYLQNAQVSLFASGETSTLSIMGLGRAVGGGMAGLQMLDSPTMDCPQTAGSDLAANSGNIGLGGQSQVNAMARPGRETAPLPPDASNTVYVEGLPPDSTRREVARILLAL